jgi:sirohydrochlorin ferrochelatase
MAEVVVEELAEQVRRELPGRRVAVAYLDFSAPSVGEALRGLAADGVRDVVAVPLLFAPGYHLRVDLPAAIAEVRAGHPELRVVIAPALGETTATDRPDGLLDALESRLREAGAASDRYDAVVLASAGSSDPLARAAVKSIGHRWAQRLGRPVVAAYATACGPTVSDAIEELRGRGLERVAVAGLFLAPGRLPSAVQRDASAAGALVVAEPLGTDDRLVALIAQRAATVSRSFVVAG